MRTKADLTSGDDQFRFTSMQPDADGHAKLTPRKAQRGMRLAYAPAANWRVIGRMADCSKPPCGKKRARATARITASSENRDPCHRRSAVSVLV